MTKTEYKKIINDYINNDNFDIVYELAATDTANIDSIAELLIDEVAATIDIEYDDETADTEQDNFINAAYEALMVDHADDVKRGEKIQALMIAITNDPDAFNEYNNNIWYLFEILDNTTPEQLAQYEKRYINK